MRIILYLGALTLLFQSLMCIKTEQSFEQLVQELNALCATYEPLNPNNGPIVALKDYGLSYAVLQKEFADIEDIYLSKDKDSVELSGIIQYYQLKIKTKFREVMNHPDMVKHDLQKLIAEPILVSDDKKLYALSIDEKTGGTYLSRITIYHYADPSTTDEKLFENFASDGYNEIYTLKSKSGAKYLLIGSVRTCSTCMATYALLTHYENGNFVKDFETVLEGRFSGDITYAPKTKILSASYQTSDLMRECSCIIGQEQFTLPGIADIETDTQDCLCTYKFDGSTFKLTSQQQSQAKKE